MAQATPTRRQKHMHGYAPDKPLWEPRPLVPKARETQKMSKNPANKKRKEELKQAIVSKNPEAMLVDGHDDALVGYDTKGRAIYFTDHIIGTLMQRDGMTEEEAVEFFDFNIECAYVGEFTPIYMYEE